MSRRRPAPLHWSFTLRAGVAWALVSIGGEPGLLLLAFLVHAHRVAPPFRTAIPRPWAAVRPPGAGWLS